jgi:hypothetical protein
VGRLYERRANDVHEVFVRFQEGLFDAGLRKPVLRQRVCVRDGKGGNVSGFLLSWCFEEACMIGVLIALVRCEKVLLMVVSKRLCFAKESCEGNELWEG